MSRIKPCSTLPTFWSGPRLRIMHTLPIALLILSVFSHNYASAQFNIYPHAHKTSGADIQNTRTQDLGPMKLPFWDDFSFAGSSRDTLWAQKEDVIILDGFAIRPPTQGAAIMDGTRANGSPFETDLTTNSITDVLVSRKIMLAEVPVANRASVYLSFQYQWKANGEAPDPSDFLQVDFMNDQGEWITQDFIRVTEDPDPTIFLDYIKQVSSEVYFHNDFQFRISRFGRSSGPFDTWAIDYVYLNQNRFATDFSFPDRAIGAGHTSLFGKYFGVPQQHLYGNEIINAPSFLLTTQKNEGTPLDQFTYLNTKNYFGETFTEHDATLDSPAGLFISAFGKIETPIENLPDLANTTFFDRQADSTTVTLKTILTSSDNISIYTIPEEDNADYDDLIYAPIDFRVNDTLQTSYNISDYYAYDDGIAEYSLGLAQTGNEAAFGFTKLGSEADTLTGVYIYFPQLTGQLSTIVDLLIFADNAGSPGTLIGEEVISIRRPGLNIFHKIALRNAVLVPQNFYVGWRQPANGLLSIGLDKGVDNSDKLFDNANGGWKPASNIFGTPMIRPIFGKGEITTALPEYTNSLELYPNPVTNTFFINRIANVLSIYNINGQEINFTTNHTFEGTQVTLTQSTQGLALVKLKVGNEIIVRKIVIQ
ncbi:T9SS type A sorting domain-containing protein [Chryseotalea sanaruensis]|nr:T9SS type A sorting domain-containing protein [Chryseotalea sanaruensis]